ncbi:hypothetical protein LT679_04970 [Mucilaginibacter roseus]|uniref:Heme NO-binding domain-containing protein n=1 Tax=Mucilaginibacter roseus TaxID=1528868 RepID=A0ABS8U347_9SPHI|nr:hypothetical protein [Mucilaginibacter roseus]MCD8739943.1 hypothetical protein [Mucilaginibacter roseus]
MYNRIIRICYRKIIDGAASKAWDRLVFDDSYTEYRMQVQNFERAAQYPLYTDLLKYNPEVIKMNHMVSGAVMGYLQLLNNIMPDVLNTLGRRFLKFNQFKFEIINSHLENKEKHRISITFYSEPVYWLDTIGQNLLLTGIDQQQDMTLTDLLPLTQYLSIYSIQNQEINNCGTNASYHIFSR